MLQAFPMLQYNDGSFTVGGKKFKSVEHWFQANKYREQEDVFDIIRSQPTAAKAKQENYKQWKYHNNPIDFREWKAKRNHVMLQGLRAKFFQNPALAKVLLSTKTLTLQECGHDYWCGLNGRLGLLLMKVRDELRKSSCSNDLKEDTKQGTMVKRKIGDLQKECQSWMKHNLDTRVYSLLQSRGFTLRGLRLLTCIQATRMGLNATEYQEMKSKLHVSNSYNGVLDLTPKVSAKKRKITQTGMK